MSERESILALLRQGELESAKPLIMGSDLRRNTEFALEAVAINGLVLQYFLGDPRHDKEVALAAVTNNGMAIRFVGNLANTKEILATALLQTPAAFDNILESRKGLLATLLNGKSHDELKRIARLLFDDFKAAIDILMEGKERTGMESPLGYAVVVPTEGCCYVKLVNDQMEPLIEMSFSRRTGNLDSFFYDVPAAFTAQARATAKAQEPSRTLAGLGMDWVFQVANTMRAEHILLTDSWNHLATKETSADLMYQADLLLTRRDEFDVFYNLKKQAEESDNPQEFLQEIRHMLQGRTDDFEGAARLDRRMRRMGVAGDDKPRYLQRVRDGGFYGQWGFIGDAIKVKDYVHLQAAFCDFWYIGDTMGTPIAAMDMDEYAALRTKIEEGKGVAVDENASAELLVEIVKQYPLVFSDTLEEYSKHIDRVSHYERMYRHIFKGTIKDGEFGVKWAVFISTKLLSIETAHKTYAHTVNITLAQINEERRSCEVSVQHISEVEIPKIGALYFAQERDKDLTTIMVRNPGGSKKDALTDALMEAIDTFCTLATPDFGHMLTYAVPKTVLMTFLNAAENNRGGAKAAFAGVMLASFNAFADLCSM